MLFLAVMNLTATTKFEICDILHADKQKSGKKRSVKKTLGFWNTEQLVSSEQKRKGQVSFLGNAAKFKTTRMRLKHVQQA